MNAPWPILPARLKRLDLNGQRFPPPEVVLVHDHGLGIVPLAVASDALSASEPKRQSHIDEDPGPRHGTSRTRGCRPVPLANRENGKGQDGDEWRGESMDDPSET